MKKEAVLVLIKPDAIRRQLEGSVINHFSETKLELVAMKLIKPTSEKVKFHYKHIIDQPFFQGVSDLLLGKTHKTKYVIGLVYYGTDAIKKSRKLAGATNPEEADPLSLRGKYGRITTKRVYENVVHVSSDVKEAEREIKLWFEPTDFTKKIYSTTIVQSKNSEAWK